MFQLNRPPYYSLTITELQQATEHALNRMVAHQRVAESLMDLSCLVVAGKIFEYQADHHFRMACYWRKRAGDFWTIWQARLRPREEFLAECEQVAANA